MKKLHFNFLLLFIICSTSTCTTQAWYEGARTSQDVQCLKESKGDYEACKAANKQTYEEYKRANEELKSPAPSPD